MRILEFPIPITDWYWAIRFCSHYVIRTKQSHNYNNIRYMRSPVFINKTNEAILVSAAIPILFFSTNKVYLLESAAIKISVHYTWNIVFCRTHSLAASHNDVMSSSPPIEGGALFELNDNKYPYMERPHCVKRMLCTLSWSYCLCLCKGHAHTRSIHLTNNHTKFRYNIIHDPARN